MQEWDEARFERNFERDLHSRRLKQLQHRRDLISSRTGRKIGGGKITDFEEEDYNNNVARNNIPTASDNSLSGIFGSGIHAASSLASDGISAVGSVFESVRTSEIMRSASESFGNNAVVFSKITGVKLPSVAIRTKDSNFRIARLERGFYPFFCPKTEKMSKNINFGAKNEISDLATRKFEKEDFLPDELILAEEEEMLLNMGNLDTILSPDGNSFSGSNNSPDQGSEEYEEDFELPFVVPGVARAMQNEFAPLKVNFLSFKRDNMIEKGKTFAQVNKLTLSFVRRVAVVNAWENCFSNEDSSAGPVWVKVLNETDEVALLDALETANDAVIEGRERNGAENANTNNNNPLAGFTTFPHAFTQFLTEEDFLVAHGSEMAGKKNTTENDSKTAKLVFQRKKLLQRKLSKTIDIKLPAKPGKAKICARVSRAELEFRPVVSKKEVEKKQKQKEEQQKQVENARKVQAKSGGLFVDEQGRPISDTRLGSNDSSSQKPPVLFRYRIAKASPKQWESFVAENEDNAANSQQQQPQRSTTNRPKSLLICGVHKVYTKPNVLLMGEKFSIEVEGECLGEYISLVAKSNTVISSAATGSGSLQRAAVSGGKRNGVVKDETVEKKIKDMKREKLREKENAEKKKKAHQYPTKERPHAKNNNNGNEAGDVKNDRKQYQAKNPTASVKTNTDVRQKNVSQQQTSTAGNRAGKVHQKTTIPVSKQPPHANNTMGKKPVPTNLANKNASRNVGPQQARNVPHNIPQQNTRANVVLPSRTVLPKQAQQKNASQNINRQVPVQNNAVSTEQNSARTNSRTKGAQQSPRQKPQQHKPAVGKHGPTSSFVGGITPKKIIPNNVQVPSPHNAAGHGSGKNADRKPDSAPTPNSVPPKPTVVSATANKPTSVQQPTQQHTVPTADTTHSTVPQAPSHNQPTQAEEVVESAFEPMEEISNDTETVPEDSTTAEESEITSNSILPEEENNINDGTVSESENVVEYETETDSSVLNEEDVPTLEEEPLNADSTNTEENIKDETAEEDGTYSKKSNFKDLITNLPSMIFTGPTDFRSSCESGHVFHHTLPENLNTGAGSHNVNPRMSRGGPSGTGGISGSGKNTPHHSDYIFGKRRSFDHAIVYQGSVTEVCVSFLLSTKNQNSNNDDNNASSGENSGTIRRSSSFFVNQNLPALQQKWVKVPQAKFVIAGPNGFFPTHLAINSNFFSITITGVDMGSFFKSSDDDSTKTAGSTIAGSLKSILPSALVGGSHTHGENGNEKGKAT